MIRYYLPDEALLTIKTAPMVRAIPRPIAHVMGSLNKNQAIKAVVGGVKYIKLVTAAAAPRSIIMYSKELAPKLKASTDQAKAPINGGTHWMASVSIAAKGQVTSKAAIN